MNHFVRRGFAVVAGGLLALSMAACNDNDSASTDNKKDDDKGSLACKDLGKQVDKAAPDDSTPISQFEDKKFDQLTKWMTDNGGDFKKEDLGKAVSDWGSLSTAYFNDRDGTGDAVSEEDASSFEKAAGTIDKECKGLGFALEKGNQQGGDQQGGDQQGGDPGDGQQGDGQQGDGQQGGDPGDGQQGDDKQDGDQGDGTN